MHLYPETAEKYGLKDGDIVDIQTEGERSVTLHNVLVRAGVKHADEVHIDTLSYQKGAEPAKWRCNGGIDYEMEAGERTERGTTITLFIGADGEEFLNEATLYAAMRILCSCPFPSLWMC